VSVPQGVEELSAKELSEGAHGKEVVAGDGDPALGLRGQTPSGDDAVDMRVKAQIASPCVEDRGERRQR